MAQSRGEHALPSAAFAVQKELASQESVGPHSQLAKFGFVLLSVGQTCTAEHLLTDEVQNIPLNELQALVPQEQSTVLFNTPLLLGQTLPLEQVLLDELQ